MNLMAAMMCVASKYEARIQQIENLFQIKDYKTLDENW